MGEFYRYQVVPTQFVHEAEVAKGRRYKLTYNDQPLTRFGSQEQMLEVMAEIDEETGKPLYEVDGIYRATIQDLIANSRGVEGVNSDTPRPDRGEVDFYEAARKEALRAHAAKMHEQLGTADPIKKWEAIQWVMNPENAGAVRQAQEVYGDPTGPLTRDLQASHGDGSNRIVLGPSDPEQAALIDDLSK